MTATEPREKRNRVRRERRRQEARLRMGRHAASELISHGEWENGQPTATPADVIQTTNAMYGSYLKGVPLTTAEAEIALAFGLDLKASFADNQRPVREAARRLLADADTTPTAA